MNMMIYDEKSLGELLWKFYMNSFWIVTMSDLESGSKGQTKGNKLVVIFSTEPSKHGESIWINNHEPNTKKSKTVYKKKGHGTPWKWWLPRGFIAHDFSPGITALDGVVVIGIKEFHPTKTLYYNVEPAR